MGLRPNPNGQLLRNLIVGASQLQDCLLHFYTLCALDFIDIAAVLDYKGSDLGMNAVRDWAASELSSNKVLEAGNGLLDSFVNESWDSIAKGQARSFQDVMDNVARIEEVKETALYAPSGLMTYL